MMTDQTNAFDGTNSYLTYYTTGWQSSTGVDLYMILKNHIHSNWATVSSLPPAGTYTGTQSVTLATPSLGTIFFTTDGSAPTTSSMNGSSPITGIIVKTNSTLKFFAKDNIGNIGPMGSAHYTILIPVVTQMNDTTASYGLTAYSGKQIMAEYISTNSSLVGKSIDMMTVQLKKGGSPTGAVQVGIFNNDLSVKQLFGTFDSSTLTTSYTQYTFALSSPQTYQIQSGDRIGIKFTGGNSSNFVAMMTDQTNAFDGTNSYLTYYTTTWNSLTVKDLYMILKLHIY
jgi:hypothetical protein